MTTPALSVIIVNYNTADLLPGCLDSIGRQGVSCEIIVVDNASRDQSVDLLHERYPGVTVIANRTNEGFSRANNQGLRRCRGELVFFLNPDTIVQPGCLAAMLDFMPARPEVAMAGTALFDPDFSPHPSVEYTYPGHRYARQELSGLPGDIAWILGAALVSRRDRMERVGGFDERFFLYGEDVDLGLVMRKRGWRLGSIPGAGVVHLEGQSERNSAPMEVFKKKLRAELLFYDKHYSENTVRRICRAYEWQARWRLFSLRLTLPWCRDRETAGLKRDRYRVALEFYNGRKSGCPETGRLTR
ncbi:MAG TPA: glycosyltransferase family 2 protein [Desulfobacteraceae bacterium]|nr:glycosyltransferase family 2 protein [Desulfobacteraceae bacterium]